MSGSLKKQKYYVENSPNQDYSYQNPPRRRNFRVVKKQKRAKKKNIFASFLATIFLASYGYFVCPYNFKAFFEPLFLNRFLNKEIKPDIKPYFSPALNYTKNSFLLGKYLFAPSAKKTKEITQIQILQELTPTKQKLLELFKKYPKLNPSVFVWDYSSGSGLEINADVPYASASIIKIPIAFELMRLIDETSKTPNPVTLSDKRIFTETFRTSGSGRLQYTQGNVAYSINHLASIMISESDNSATNMILYEIGGLDGFNRAMRNLGLKTTSMGDWLPDLEGNNKITAREISTILYNIDNPNYINPKYKTVLKEYLLSTKNIHLLKEKLPEDALVFHKTGNIGSMLGDSGIVYAKNGKKYIVTILVQRPHNDFRARTLIQDASALIYNDIIQMN